MNHTTIGIDNGGTRPVGIIDGNGPMRGWRYMNNFDPRASA
jgi:hypothetical protein